MQQEPSGSCRLNGRQTEVYYQFKNTPLSTNQTNYIGKLSLTGEIKYCHPYLDNW